jgi:hypothetical protein
MWTKQQSTIILNLYIFFSFQGEVTPSESNPTPDGKADFIESLSYFADPNHNGQSLRCVLDQMGYTPQQLEQDDNVVKLDLELLCKMFFY